MKIYVDTCPMIYVKNMEYIKTIWLRNKKTFQPDLTIEWTST